MSSRLRSQIRNAVPYISFGLLYAIVIPVSSAEPTAEQAAFFENEIRPLLVKHCYECHSDPENAEGELLLTHLSALKHGGASGPAAIAGQPKESLLIQAVEYRGIEMPPNGKLPQTEIDKLTRWVEMGLPWPGGDNDPEMAAEKGKTFQFTEEHLQHWAFQPIASPAPPEVDNPAWSTNPIDQFLLDAMQPQGVTPNQIADRKTLLRRVTYDLTGLPPTPDELSNFLSDESETAWEKVVDRLLASTHYGEQWGRHWLDVVRYADTAGDASDYPLPDAYKYRNYVIRSFNNDKPYDQFLKEQYAGDLMAATAPPEQFEELITATTQLAISRRFGYNDTNFQYFHLTIQDLLDTMGQSVLGLSIGCARCHDHKFEPISAKDYYALYGIFSSSKFTFPGAEEVHQPKDLIPTIPPEEVVRREQTRKLEVAQLQEQLRLIPNLEGSFESGEKFPASWKRDAEAQLITNSSSPYRNVFPEGKQAVQLPNDPRNLGIRRPIPTQTAESQSPLYFNIDFRNVSIDAGGDGYYRIALDHPENSYSPAVEIFVNGSQLAVRDNHSLREVAPLEVGIWYNLQFEVNWPERIFSGVLSNGSDHWRFENIPFNSNWDGTVNSWVVDGSGTDSALVKPLRELDNFSVQNVPHRPATEPSSLTSVEFQDQLSALQETWQQLQDELNSLVDQPLYPTVYGVQEGEAADAHIQFRGEPERSGEAVPRGFLEILGGEKLPDDCQESGRRQLAEWLTSAENPLTSRVLVNRLWYYHFGRGIVATPNDFGVRGEPPTHPQLLDFLATKFQEEGYSIKAMHRLILNSRAYQLSCDTGSNANSIDPDNTWFWRHNRRRLDAESLRDSWLMLSGELNQQMGGPHPFPPISSWKFSQHNPFEAVYQSHERSVYLMTQRIKRHPFLGLFDGADPNATTGIRDLTTTPSQALFLMNDQFMHQRSQEVARQLMREFSTRPEQISRLYEIAYARLPTAVEIENGQMFCANYAEKIPTTSEPEVLSLSAFVRVILSSNEFLYLN